MRYLANCGLSFSKSFQSRDRRFFHLLFLINFRIAFLFQMADVWSCGVTLFVMLVGAYPFEDQEDPKNFRKTISVSYILLCCNNFMLISAHSFF